MWTVTDLSTGMEYKARSVFDIMSLVSFQNPIKPMDVIISVIRRESFANEHWSIERVSNEDHGSSANIELGIVPGDSAK